MERSRIAKGCAIAAGLTVAMALMGALLVCAGLWSVGAALNTGRLALDEVGSDWTVSTRGAALTGPAVPVASALERRCRPMTNGLRVLLSHLWFNAMARGYDTRIDLVEVDGADSYTLYVWDDHVFLRDGADRAGRRNRVLTCELGPADWEALAGAPRAGSAPRLNP